MAETGFRKGISGYFTRPLVRILARTPVTPNVLSWTGFAITLVSGLVIGYGHLFVAGWLVLFAGLFDMLDGALARQVNRITRFGAALDSTLDRLSEAILFLSLMVWFAQNQEVLMVLVTGATLVGSFMVSYIRARAEGIGLELKDGLFTRAERVIVLALGLLLSRFGLVLATAIYIILVFSLFTAGQRLYLVWRKARTS